MPWKHLQGCWNDALTYDRSPGDPVNPLVRPSFRLIRLLGLIGIGELDGEGGLPPDKSRFQIDNLKDGIQVEVRPSRVGVHQSLDSGAFDVPPV